MAETPKKDPKAERDARLKEAFLANLRRRKTQAKQKQSSESAQNSQKTRK